MSRLSVSNIAWPHSDRRAIYSDLATAGFQGVEVALTKFASWDELDHDKVIIERELLEIYDLSVSSYQSLYFGRPDLQLLGDTDSYDALVEHTIRVASLAEAMSGGGPGVFGAPRNRLRGKLDEKSAFDLGADRLCKLANAVAPMGFVLVLEPAPPQYGGDFLMTEAACAEMVRQVNHPSLRLHVDIGCIALAGEVRDEIVENHIDIIEHVHISKPQLAPVGVDDRPRNLSLLQLLSGLDYKGWVAIEMREVMDSHAALNAAVASLQHR